MIFCKSVNNIITYNNIINNNIYFDYNSNKNIITLNLSI